MTTAARHGPDSTSASGDACRFCSGAARVIEHAARLAADSEKLTLHMRPIADLLREADYRARSNDDQIVPAAHVQRAIEAQSLWPGRAFPESPADLVNGRAAAPR